MKALSMYRARSPHTLRLSIVRANNNFPFFRKFDFVSDDKQFFSLAAVYVASTSMFMCVCARAVFTGIKATEQPTKEGAKLFSKLQRLFPCLGGIYCMHGLLRPRLI